MTGWGIAIIGLASVIGGIVIGIPVSSLIIRYREDRLIKEYTRAEALAKPKPAGDLPATNAIARPSPSRANSLLPDASLRAPAAPLPPAPPDIPLNGASLSRAPAGKPDDAGKVAVNAGSASEQELSKQFLIREIEDNLRRAHDYSGAEPVAFATKAWNENLIDSKALPEYVRRELSKVYLDIDFANNIVWLWETLGSKNPDLINRYAERSARIAASLEAILYLLLRD